MVSDMIPYTPGMKLSATYKHGKLVIDDETIKGLCALLFTVMFVLLIDVK